MPDRRRLPNLVWDRPGTVVSKLSTAAATLVAIVLKRLRSMGVSGRERAAWVEGADPLDRLPGRTGCRRVACRRLGLRRSYLPELPAAADHEDRKHQDGERYVSHGVH